jgi:hypothetical protein
MAALPEIGRARRGDWRRQNNELIENLRDDQAGKAAGEVWDFAV